MAGLSKTTSPWGHIFCAPGHITIPHHNITVPGSQTRFLTNLAICYKAISSSKENVGVKIKEATKNIDETQENDKCKESEAEKFDDIGMAKVSKSVKKLKAELNKAISIKKNTFVRNK